MSWTQERRRLRLRPPGRGSLELRARNLSGETERAKPSEGGPEEPKGGRASRPAALLLLGCGAVLIAFAALYNEFLATLLDPSPSLSRVVINGIRLMQRYLLGTGLVFLLAGYYVRRWRWCRSLFRTSLANNILLALLASFLPLFVLELALRPFADFGDPGQKTTIFMRDEELGWRMRPFAEDVWGGHRVRINGKGLRGLELDYSKPERVLRILFLGDSVTFGDRLESFEQTFCSQTAARLEPRLGQALETINAGVSGYSPWQEFRYLSREGIRYSPDLVVVGFVLNDVTEKFDLMRFGGSGEGWQLASTYSSYVDRLADKSAIVNVAKRLGAVIRFGGQVEQGAKRRETLDVQSLVDHPDREDVRRAWEVTLGELDLIWEFCRARGVPALLVVFPFRFQLADLEGGRAPQEILARHTEARGVPMLDTLPHLAQDMRRRGLRPEHYFLDSNHFSPFGNQVVAEILSAFVEKKGLLHRARSEGSGSP